MCKCEDRPCCGCESNDGADPFAPEDDINPQPEDVLDDDLGEMPYAEDAFIDGEFESRFDMGDY